MIQGQDSQDRKQTQRPDAASTTVSQAQAAIDTAQYNSLGDGISLGFGGNDLFLMNAAQGSEYTMGLANAVKESFQTVHGKKPKISVLDKESISNLAYSTVVLSMQNGNIVNYFAIVLEATGRKPMKASEVMAEINAVAKIPNQRPMIGTTDDALDKIMHEEIRRALVQEYSNEVILQAVDGIVVPTSIVDTAKAAKVLAAIAYNAITIEAKLASGENADLNIQDAMRKVQGNLRLTHDMSRSPMQNEMGSPVRSDFKIELALVNANQTMQSMNMQNARNVLSKVSGYVDAVPQTTQVQTPQGMVAGTRLHPNIVLTSLGVPTPTPGFTLMALTASLVMLGKNMWMAGVIPSDINDTGALNILTNLENNPQPALGAPIDLMSKKMQPADMYGILGQMYSLAPIVSVDIQSFGPQAYYTSVFATAAQPGNSKSKWDASKIIVDTAVWLTAGAFPKDFPLEKIFADSGVVIPLGTWADKTGERDIRDVDLSFIAKRASNMEEIVRWANSAASKERSGLDSYLTRVELIAKHIPDADITGKAIRVTFSAQFLQTLYQAVSTAGLNPRYDAAVQLPEANNLAMLGGFTSAAGIDAGAGYFQQQQGPTGPNVFVPYSYMGVGRF